MGGSPPPLAAGAVGHLKLLEWVTEFVSAFAQAPQLKAFVADVIQGTAPSALSTLSAWTVHSRADFLKQMAQVRAQIEQIAGPHIQEFLAIALSDYFGVSVSPGLLGLRGNKGGRQVAASAVGQAVLAGMFGSLETAGGITPARGKENADRLLSFALQNAIEGWLIGTLGLGWLETEMPDVGKLGDLVSANLGVGRISRQALRPALDALVVNPATEFYNSIYAPSLPAEGQAVRLLHRGAISESDYFDIMARRGWSRDRAAQLRVILSDLPTRSDLRGLYELGMLSEQEVSEYLQAGGAPPELAQALTVLIREDRLRTIRGNLATLARDMYRDREIDDAEFSGLAGAAGYSSEEREALLNVARVERSRPKRVDRSTMERAYVEGVVEINRLRAFYEAEGYSALDAGILEQLVVMRKLEEDAKRPPEPGVPAPAKPQRIPRSVAEEAFRRSLMDEAALRAIYLSLGFLPDAVQQLVAVQAQRRTEYQAALARKLAPPRGITTSAGTIEEAFVRGLVDEQTLAAFYVQRGFLPADIPLLLALRRAERADYVQAQQDANAKAAESGQQPRA